MLLNSASYITLILIWQIQFATMYLHAKKKNVHYHSQQKKWSDKRALDSISIMKNVMIWIRKVVWPRLTIVWLPSWMMIGELPKISNDSKRISFMISPMLNKFSSIIMCNSLLIQTFRKINFPRFKMLSLVWSDFVVNPDLCLKVVKLSSFCV